MKKGEKDNLITYYTHFHLCQLVVTNTHPQLYQHAWNAVEL